MMNLNKKIDALVKLGVYMDSNNEEWLQAKDMAIQSNAWFTADHIDSAVKNIVTNFLQKEKLEDWISQYSISDASKNVGITMAGNIPLVGFHDFLCGYLSGHHIRIKYSSKDQILLPHLIRFLKTIDPQIESQIQSAEMLKNCDAYIATGSNNTARYFEQYFAKYPHIIRRNRTSVAILEGTESEEELAELAKDIFLYFGLGCRNVSQVCLPRDYDFNKLWSAFKAYEDLINHNKYKNNYDYYLAIYLLNRVPYQTNDALLMVENESPFSAVSVLHYRYYDDKTVLLEELDKNSDLQCMVSKGHTPFGAAQIPSLSDYADGVDTMNFLTTI